MKKIFTLLVSAVMAGSAVAAPAIPTTKLAATRVAPTAMSCVKGESNMIAQLPGTSEGMQRIMLDGQNAEWNVAMMIMGTATEMLGLVEMGTQNFLSFEQIPYYLVTIASIKGDESCNLQYYLMWPCRAILEKSVINQADGTVNWDKADQFFGSRKAAQLPAGIDEVRAYMENIIPALNGIYSLPSILPSYMFGELKWNGNGNLALKPCTLTNQGISTDGSFLKWENYDPDYDDSTMNFDMKLGTADSQGNVVGSIPANYVLTGTPTIMGFSSKIMNFDEVHVFDCGLTDSWSEFGQIYDEEDWTPVHRYYIAWVDASMSFSYTDEKGQEVHAWDDQFIKSPYLLQDMRPIAKKVEVPDYNFFSAALYVAENEPLQGIWSMPEPKFTENDRYQITRWESVPTPFELVPNYSYGCAQQDAFKGRWNAWLMNPQPMVSFIGFGDKTLGFNFSVSSEGWGDNNISGYFNGTYTFHPDINDWNKTEQRPCVGTADANVSAVETVFESNAPVVSTQYFNLQGQRLNAAPQQGIFIQRDIKADGTVKAVKIAK